MSERKASSFLEGHILIINFSKVNFDGFVKSPTSLLRFIPSFFNVRQVRLIAEDSRASNLKLFTLPSKFDFFTRASKLSQNY